MMQIGLCGRWFVVVRNKDMIGLRLDVTPHSHAASTWEFRDCVWLLVRGGKLVAVDMLPGSIKHFVRKCGQESNS